MANVMHSLLTSRPVNKAAAVVTNQRGCSEAMELNRMIDERRILRENIKVWAAECIGNPKHGKEIRRQLGDAGNRLAEINKIMRDNPDMKSAAKFKTLNDAFVSIAREVLPRHVFGEIIRRARAATRVNP